MTSISIVTRWWSRRHPSPHPVWLRRIPTTRAPDLHHLGCHPQLLPRFVRDSAVAQRYLQLLSSLDWGHFPERDLECYRYRPPVPYAPFAAACLVQLTEKKPYMSDLRTYLVEHPALVWLLGFPLVAARQYPWKFDADASLPTPRHFTRMLRMCPNASLQWLLDDTVRLLRTALSDVQPPLGQAISLDTKHILAWVKQNNPKAYVKDRYAKEKHPTGDPDCRLGCKRKRNQRAASEAPPPTPLDEPVPAATIAVGDYYWGYASGVVATKIPMYGEFVLAELTLAFDRPDVAYFFPLLADTERRLGFRPRYAALDASYDAWYVYAHFQQAEQPWTYAFAAVPLTNRNSHSQFSPQGLPLCKAGLPMPVKNTFFSKTAFVPHERAHHHCPLQYPTVTADTCPVNDNHWEKGGCRTTLPSSIGTRLRHRINRDSQLYKDIYKQRTATERINSQAKALGIERPHLRNGQAIANRNTLIYVLINLRALQRVRKMRAQQQAA